MRRERGQAIAAVMRAILEHVSLHNGFLNYDQRTAYIIGRSVDDLAEQAGMNQRTFERALSDLHRLGWLKSWQRGERQPCGRYIGHRAARQVTPAFWRLVGLFDDFLTESRKAWRRFRAAREAGDPSADAPARFIDRNRKYRTRREDHARVAELLSGYLPPPGYPAS